MRRHDTIPTILIAATTLALLCGCGTPTTGSQHASAGSSPTAAPSPTPTAGPPTPTPTAQEQRLDALVQPAVGTLASNVAVRVDAASEAAGVTATVKQCSDVATTQELVKTVAFRTLKTLWTSGESFKDVNVAVLGPFQDDFGNQTVQAYGSADVTAQTAAKLNWTALSPDMAWNAYTNVFLAVSYASGQYWGLPTPTPLGAPGDIQACAAA